MPSLIHRRVPVAVLLVAALVGAPGAASAALLLSDASGPRLRIDAEGGGFWWHPLSEEEDWRRVSFSLRLPGREITSDDGLLLRGVERTDERTVRLDFSSGDPPAELSVLLSLADGLRVQPWLVNTGTRDLAVSSVTVLEFPEGLDATPGPWRMLIDSGKAQRCGVDPLDKSRGSSLQTVLYDPTARRAVLLGFLSNGTAEGRILVDPAAGGGAPGRVRAVAHDPGTLGPGEVWVGDPLRLVTGADPLELLEAFAAEVRAEVEPPIPEVPLAGFMTWYRFGTAIDEAGVTAIAAAVAPLVSGFPRPMQRVFLVDHGWTPEARIGDWKSADPRRFPHGMAWLSRELKSEGMTLGLWCTPFCLTDDTDAWRLRQPLLLREPGGRPVTVPLDIWGDGARRARILDASLAGTGDSVRDDLAVMNDWGVGFWKLDFFFVKGGRGAPPPWQLGSEAWRTIRDAVDPADLVMPCTSETNRYLGKAGIMNIASDIGPGGNGPEAVGRIREVFETVACNWFKHGAYWRNDLQVVRVGTMLTPGEARLSATMVALAGAGFWVGDPPAELPEDRLDMLRRCLPVYGRAARPVTLFSGADPAREAVVWVLPVESAWAPGSTAVAVFNLTDMPQEVTLPSEWFGIPADVPFVAWEWWGGSPLDPATAALDVSVPPMDVAVLHALPAAGEPRVAGTSLHYAPGWILDGIRWDGGTRTLSGDISTRPGIGGFLYGIAPETLVPVDAEWEAIGSPPAVRWRVAVTTTAPRTPFSIAFAPR